MASLAHRMKAKNLQKPPISAFDEEPEKPENQNSTAGKTTESEKQEQIPQEEMWEAFQEALEKQRVIRRQEKIEAKEKAAKEAEELLANPPEEPEEEDEDSWGSLGGSLAKLRQELLDSVYKNICMSNETPVSSNPSDQTDSEEVYSIFKNSGLKIRGIDLDNLVTKNGQKFDFYQLFKARFQMYDTGKARIDNHEVVQLVRQILGKELTDSARKFMCCDNSDYRKGAFKPERDSNYKEFANVWREHKDLQDKRPKAKILPPSLQNIQNFEEVLGGREVSQPKPPVTPFE